MCGGGSIKKAVKGVTKVATLGLTDDPVQAATLGTAESTAGGGVSVLGQDVVPGVPELPILSDAPTREAAARAAEDKERKRVRAARGKRRTILTSPRGVTTDAPVRKSLLGQ